MNRVIRTVRPVDAGPAGAALAAFAAGTSGVGFCYRPADVRWFRFASDGVARSDDGSALDLTGVFELRAFTGEAELRWLHDGGGTGTAHWIGESDTDRSRPGLPWRLQDKPYERLLWGAVVGERNDHGWVTLHDGRIGTLPVPVDGPAPEGSLVWLQAVEYAENDKHGNVAVVDERLVGLVARPFPTPKDSKPKDKGAAR
ncbi:CRISPR-associated protein Csx19 [Micromonospora sp. LOL_013]|uniref:type III-D CRISPR-associated protein Csx19 n=1 Tax=Micromonospora sp. LOL_013 TaxID=3345414 RepID=UPI003A88F88C